jgi:tetratricopeptide (TPR) repeat protein
LGAAECLKQLGRMDEAEKISTDASKIFDSNPYTHAALASFATETGDFDEAVRSWMAIIELFPSFDSAYTMGAEASRKIGRESEADELLRQVVARSPLYLAGQLAYARSAHRRADWTQARERWAVVLESFPDCVEAWEKAQEALAALDQHVGLLSDPAGGVDTTLFDVEASTRGGVGSAPS